MELPGENDTKRLAEYLKSLAYIGGAILFVASFWFVTKNEMKAHAESEAGQQTEIVTEIQKLRTSAEQEAAQAKTRSLLNCTIASKGDSDLIDMCIRMNQ